MKKGMAIIISILVGVMLGVIWTRKCTNTMIEKTQKLADKYLTLFLMMNQWVKVKQADKKLEQCFTQKGYRRIAIYGMSYVGETLVRELKDTDVKVIYGIDRNAGGLSCDVEVFSVEDALESVDAVVVTPITYFQEIYQQLSKKLDCPIISMEDILYDV